MEFQKKLIAPLLLLALALPAAGADAKFDQFWARFKAAVQKNDKAAIAEMTKFPYLLQGKSIGRAEFLKSCGTIFDAATRKCLVKEKPVKDKDAYFVFCGEEIFIFAKEKDRYLFTEIGVND